MSPRVRTSGVSATSRTISAVPPAEWMRASGPSLAPHAASSTTSARARRICKDGRRGIRAETSGGTMASAIVFTLCLIAALGVFFRQLWDRFNLLRAAAPVPRFDRIPDRIRAVLVYAFGQQKFVRPEVA